MELCKHGLRTITCGACKAIRMPPVYVSAGGDAYHSRSRCPAFLEGQRKARRVYDSVHEIRLVSQIEASLGDYLPCRACFPDQIFATRAG
jgi:hypothetical protein